MKAASGTRKYNAKERKLILQGLAGKRVENHVSRRDETGSSGKVAHYGLSSPWDGAVWSGSMPVPVVGSRIVVNFNGFGAGVVRGYFTEPGTDCDYLGVYVECDNAPDWWVLQQVRAGEEVRRCTMAFGSELKE